MSIDHIYKSMFKSSAILCLLLIAIISLFNESAFAMQHDNSTHSESKIDSINDHGKAAIEFFEVLADPVAVTIEKESSGTVDVIINREDIFTGSVNLTIFPSPGLPNYVTASFNPTSVPNSSTSSVLTLSVGASAISGEYAVVIAGTGSYYDTTKLRTFEITLTIKDIEPPGTVASFAFLENNTTINGYSSVNNNIAVNQLDLPEIINFKANTAGAADEVKWIFKEQGSATAIQTYTDATDPYTLYNAGGWTVLPGIYELEAIQVSSGVDGNAKKIVITINPPPPPSFSISTTPASLTVFQGESISSTIKITPNATFSGEVNLVTNDLPEGVTAEFTPPMVNTEGNSIITFTVTDDAAVGSSSVIITATGPENVQANTTMDLTIERVSIPDFELTLGKKQLTLIQGEEAQVNILIKPIDGFDEDVAFEAISSIPEIQLIIEPGILEGGAGESELSIITDEFTPIGEFFIQFIASSQSRELKDTIDLLIQPIPISVIPKNQFSPNGDGIDEFWIIEEIEEAPEFSVLVFDRLGREVYRAQPYKNDWDGTDENGSQLIPTTYFYVLKDAEGKTVKSGSLNLIR